MDAEWEVLTVRFGTRASTRSESFYRHHFFGPDAPQQLDYFFWVIRNGTDVILVDTGYNATASVKKNRPMLIEPVDALAILGITPESVSQVIVSHFHFDHIGNLASFPEAKFVIQDREFDFWTGPMGKKAVFGAAVDEIKFVQQAHADGRVELINGDVVVAPGISLQLVGGHTPGQMITLVQAERRSLVLATDALHFYEGLEKDVVFPGFSDLPNTLKAYDVLRELEHRGRTIIAGHDPLVMERFPGFDTNHPDLAVRLG